MVGCLQIDPPYTAEEVDLGITMEPQLASKWCWAAVAQAIARWHGEQFTQSEIVTISFGRHCSPETCNGAYNPGKIFALIGVKETGYAQFEDWTEEEFWKHEIEREHPMKVVFTNGSSNHMVVIGGYNADGFYLYDPSTIGGGKRQVLTYEELQHYAGLRISSVSFISSLLL